MLSAVIFFAHTDADIPFTVCFGYSHGDVGILGAADILTPSSLSLLIAIISSSVFRANLDTDLTITRLIFPFSQSRNRR